MSAALEELTGWTPARTVDDAIDDVIAYESRERVSKPQAPGLRVAG
jgi:hypothetical protein